MLARKTARPLGMSSMLKGQKPSDSYVEITISLLIHQSWVVASGIKMNKSLRSTMSECLEMWSMLLGQ